MKGILIAGRDELNSLVPSESAEIQFNSSRFAFHRCFCSDEHSIQKMFQLIRNYFLAFSSLHNVTENVFSLFSSFFL